MQLGADLDGHDGHALAGATNGHATNGHGGNGTHPIGRPVGALARARGALEGFFFERRDPPRTNPEDDEPKTLTRP
jgi:hypothetical protein